MAVPSIHVNVNNNIHGVPSAGQLVYSYKPFFNKKLINIKNGVDLAELTLKSIHAKIDTQSALELNIEESYDNSVNLIVNDRKNPPKLVNSRFYLKDSRTYEIGDRKGNLDTNIYTEDNFDVESNLVKTVQTVSTLDFKGLTNGGRLPVGSYTFYFKLSDSDGNESDFIAESGKVVCHIGNINSPKHIRGGQLNENSGKGVQFILKNVDLGYSHINVYYSRSTGDASNQVVSVHKLIKPFKITGINTPILISGYEETELISPDDINVRYVEFDSTQSLVNCQNKTFAGNITNDYSLYKTLEKYSLLVTPSVERSVSIGNLDENYNESLDLLNGYEYYNAENIYYRLGYWDQEIYRFGIVYILNDYTLSPVFNIMGIKELSTNTAFESRNINSEIEANNDGIIKGINSKIPENNKGIFKINCPHSGNVFKPIGVKFNFNSSLFSGINPLHKLTKGYFIVRQQRIPTILAQAVGIGTTKHGHLPTIIYRDEKNERPYYVYESFLTKSNSDSYVRKLGSSIKSLDTNSVEKNALLCPEAVLRTDVFNTFFNSSEYVLAKSSIQYSKNGFVLNTKNKNQFKNIDLTGNSDTTSKISSNLILVEPEIELIRNGENKFSSQAGDGIAVHKNVDVIYGDYSDPTNNTLDLKLYNTSYKVRGIFNTYIGTSSNNIGQGSVYNIFEKGYDFDSYWLNYFRIRISDSSPYFPISDRIVWNPRQISGYSSGLLYRGDCYFSTYTHRMNWNFIDSELPTNTKIIDPYTWYKNFKVSKKASAVLLEDQLKTELIYNKLLPLFSYKYEVFPKIFDSEEKDTIAKNSIVEVDSENYKRYSELNGSFGYEKINKPDVNAVGLGHWVTFKICSSTNLAMRDIDLSRPMEEAVHKRKRSFYPLESMEKLHKLPESRVLNSGLSKTTSDRYYFNIGDIPFFKQFFTTRIYYSNPLQQGSFVNGNRMFLAKNFKDYSLEHGSIVKLIEWYGTLIAVMEHGILMIPVNERAMMKNESGENVYINTENVLPENPRVITNMFGSLWPDSIIKTSRFIYGIDTVAKKIWRTNGETFELISDLKIQRFLNDNIELMESDKESVIFTKSIKTHYNTFKSDVMFVFNSGKHSWNLCWNELLEKWVTRYTWFPEFSENINNIFYTFANNIKHPNAKSYLYKHGFSGTLEEKGKILPTYWYDEQHPFEFEFIVNDVQGVQKIFNNLKIISNKVEPNSFIFESVGDGYDWNEQKNDVIQLNKTLEQLQEENELTGLGSPFDLIV